MSDANDSEELKTEKAKAPKLKQMSYSELRAQQFEKKSKIRPKKGASNRRRSETSVSQDESNRKSGK